MNTLRNQVTLIGRIGKDIDFRTVGANNAGLATFTLATNDRYRNANGETVENTEWHNIKAWGKTAELLRDLASKGDEIVLKGKITYRAYEDKEGAKRRITEIVANEFVKVSKNKAA